MSHTVELPETLYRELAARAQRKGQSPEDLLLTLVEDGMRREAAEQALPLPEASSIADPIAPFIGAFECGAGDLAERHDAYFARDDDDRAEAD